MKYFVVAAILLLSLECLAWQKDSHVAEEQYFYNFMSAPTAIQIIDGGRVVMSIAFKDGSVTFGDGITPDEATKQFITQLKAQWPCGVREEPKK